MKNTNIRFAAMFMTAALAFSCAACNSATEETTASSASETTTAASETTKAQESESDPIDPSEATTVYDLELDTQYFKPVTEMGMTDEYESKPEDLEDESLQKIAQELVADDYSICTADLNAQWFAFDYPYYESEGDVAAYLYRGFSAWKIDGDTQYEYTYYIVTEDILVNDLGFTKVSEDGDKVTYEPPKAQENLQYYMDSYEYDKTLGMIIGTREMFVGGVG